MPDNLRLVVMVEIQSVAEAIHRIESSRKDHHLKPFERFEIGVRYPNGNSIHGSFNDRASAIEFLQAYQAQ